jgi:RNA polymerase sigma-70 factor (ECF subfamily)
LHQVEQDIIKRFASADVSAMDLLYANYANALYGIVFRMLGDEAAAQDVLQEAFVKIWKNAALYDSSKGRLFTWLVRIVKNQAIDAVRKSKRSGEIRGAAADVALEITPDNNRDLSTNYDISQVLSQLDVHERSLIEHSYILGFSHPEIAEKFDIPLGTVKTRIRNAMLELRRIFGNGH